VHLEHYTPDQLNNNTSQLVFSKSSGFYGDSFYLKCQSFLEDTIYYSIDGSVPNLSSNIFNDSIFIYNKTSEPNYFSAFWTIAPNSLENYRDWSPTSTNVDKANIIRCVSYRDGKPSSRVYTQTYFVDENIHTKYDVPIISLVTDEKHLFDSDSGIYVPGVHFDDLQPEWTGNYFQKGDLWEKPIHIEYFDISGNLKFLQNAGVRIHGGKTRQAPQKSLRLYARSEYGKSHFNHSIFPKTDSNKYKRFVLQGTMGCWHKSIIKDVLVSDLVSDLNIEKQDFQPAIVFLNGEYWGIHTIRDYMDENYINYTYNTENDSIQIFEGVEPIYFHFSEIFDFIEQNSLSKVEAYDYIKTQIDIENYMDYQISQMFFSNTDWPGNNVKLWRFGEEENRKLRWFFYDLDAGLDNPEYNMFTYCTNTNENCCWNNPVDATFPFRKLLEYPGFVNQFVNRVSQMLNTSFLRSQSVLRAQAIKELYANKIEDHIDRWSVYDSYASWEHAVDDLIYFLNMRPCEFSNQLMEFLAPSQFIFNCYEQNEDSSIILLPNPNNGYFAIRNTSSDNITIENLFISDFKGNLIYRENNLFLTPYAKKSFHFSSLSPGIYVLHYNHNSELSIIKFIII